MRLLTFNFMAGEGLYVFFRAAGGWLEAQLRAEQNSGRMGTSLDDPQRASTQQVHVQKSTARRKCRL